MYPKFVVADRTDDVEEAGRAVDEYKAPVWECPVHIRRLGGSSEEYNPNVPRSG